MEKKREVSLEGVLAARERRAHRQQSLLRPGAALVSFSMNIAGPVKDSVLIRRSFAEGEAWLLDGLRRMGFPCLHRESMLPPTGPEGYYLVEADPLEVKRLTAELEDMDPLGRLFDFDVLDGDGEHLSRTALGLEERGCLVCGAPGRACASRRLHPLSQVRRRIRSIMGAYFLERDLEQIAALAVRALFYEVCVTPKPGLVDRAGRGSHRDMDIYRFGDSISSLGPFFYRCGEIGWRTRKSPPEETFAALRPAGKLAECRMFQATGGVNTHKGAIFSMGAVCGALGRLRGEDGLCRGAAAVLAEVAAMTRGAMADLDRLPPRTAGARLYQRWGITGIRGEAARGMPSVLGAGLPGLRQALEAGKSIDEAGAYALLRLMASAEDTNLMARGGHEGWREAVGKVRELLDGARFPDPDAVEALDRAFCAENLSPGGCADLLAVSFLLLFLEGGWEEGQRPGGDV